jgi:hypothetical protein
MLPLMTALPATSFVDPGGTVSVTPVLIVRFRHPGVAIPAVDGEFGVPDGIVTSTPRFGTPLVQLPPVFHAELVTPVQVVVWAGREPARASRTAAREKARRY